MHLDETLLLRWGENGCVRRTACTLVLQWPVCAAHCLLPALPSHRQEQQTPPLCALQLHAGAALAVSFDGAWFIFVSHFSHFFWPCVMNA